HESPLRAFRNTRGGMPRKGRRVRGGCRRANRRLAAQEHVARRCLPPRRRCSAARVYFRGSRGRTMPAFVRPTADKNPGGAMPEIKTRAEGNEERIAAPSPTSALLEAEVRELERHRNDPASPYFTGRRERRLDRRGFLLGSVAAAGSVAGFAHAAAAVPPGSTEREVPPDATRTQGYPLADESYGSRSQFETEVRTRFKTATPQSSWTFTPLQKGCGVITPSGLHFERSHGGTAVIDPDKHQLYVHGLVRE